MENQDIKNRFKKLLKRASLGSKDPSLVWEGAYTDDGLDVIEEDGKSRIIHTEQPTVNDKIINLTHKNLQLFNYNVSLDINNKAVPFNGYEIY